MRIGGKKSRRRRAFGTHWRGESVRESDSTGFWWNTGARRCDAATRHSRLSARRALGADTITPDLHGQPTDFLAWAEHCIDQLDPLTSIAHDPDLTPAASYHADADRGRLQAELRRLFGHSWQLAQKLGAGRW